MLHVELSSLVVLYEFGQLCYGGYVGFRREN